MIVSASRRMFAQFSQAVPAVQAYDGLFARAVRKYIQERNFYLVTGLPA